MRPEEKWMGTLTVFLMTFGAEPSKRISLMGLRRDFRERWNLETRSEEMKLWEHPQLRRAAKVASGMGGTVTCATRCGGLIPKEFDVEAVELPAAAHMGPNPPKQSRRDRL